MAQTSGATGSPPFIPTPLPLQETTPDQPTQAGDSVARAESDIELLASPPAPAPAKPAPAVARMPEPTVYTSAPDTMARLGALGDHQTAADIYSFMALWAKLSQEMRNVERNQREALSQGGSNSHLDSAQKMRDAAQERWEGALFQGVCQIGSGMAQAGMSAYSASKSLQGSQLKAEGEGMLTELKDGIANMGPARQAALQTGGNALVSQGNIAEAAAGKFQAYAQAAGTASVVGNMIGSTFTLKADQHDARRAELEARASTFDTAVQDANARMEQMMASIRDVLDKLGAMDKSTVDTNRHIASNV